MKIPQDAFEEIISEHLLSMGIRDNFAEYVEWKRARTQRRWGWLINPIDRLINWFQSLFE